MNELIRMKKWFADPALVYVYINLSYNQCGPGFQERAVSYAAKFRSLGDAADRAQGFQVWRLSKPVAEVKEYLAHDNADDTRTARSVLEQVVLHSRKDVARTVVCQMGGLVNQQAIQVE